MGVIIGFCIVALILTIWIILSLMKAASDRDNLFNDDF